MLKKALLSDENRNKIKPRTGFLQFYVKTNKKVAEVLPVLAQKKSILHMACTWRSLFVLWTYKKSKQSCSMKE